MGSKVLLGDVIRLDDSRRQPLSSKQREGRKGSYPYYGAQGVVDYLDDYTYDGTYLLVAEDGENLRSRKLPLANLVTGKFRVNNHAHVLSGTDKCDIRILGWLLNSMNLTPYVTGSTQPKLSQKNLLAIELDLPSVEEQQSIMAILGSIDNKIALNQRANDYLLEMLIAVQKRQFSNSQLTECRADQAFEIHIGKTPPRKEHEWFSFDHADNAIWMSIKDMGNAGVYLIDSSEYLTQRAVEQFNIKPCKPGSVLLSFKLTIGRVGIVANEMVTNEAIACFSSSDPRKLAWLFPQLKTYDYASLGSTSSIATAVNSKMIKAMPINIPSEGVLDDFYRDAKPIYDLLLTNANEIASLEQLRDALLPKLMSGEIDVSRVDLTQLNNHLFSGAPNIVASFGCGSSIVAVID